MLFYLDPIYLLLMIVTLVISARRSSLSHRLTRNGAACTTPST
jgi:hypothetical protein